MVSLGAGAPDPVGLESARRCRRRTRCHGPLTLLWLVSASEMIHSTPRSTRGADARFSVQQQSLGLANRRGSLG